MKTGVLESESKSFILLHCAF